MNEPTTLNGQHYPHSGPRADKPKLSRRIDSGLEDEIRIHLRRQYARSGRVSIKAALRDTLGKLGGGRDHEIASRLADEMGFPRIIHRRQRKPCIPEAATLFASDPEPRTDGLTPWVVLVSPDVTNRRL